MLSMVYAMSLALSDHQTLMTLDTSKILKHRTTNLPVSLFVSPPLLTDQGNIATGAQSVTISVKPSSDMAIKYNGIDIKPGHAVSFQVTVDNQGRLSLPLSPARSGEIGKSDFEISVANIKSIHDRFWESATPTYTAWVDSGKDVDVGPWLPRVERQMRSFEQTQAYSDVHQRNKQQRRHDTNTGIYENVGSPIPESKKVPNTRTRVVSATAGTWVDNGSVHTCTAWSPNTSTQYQTVNFQQKRDCKQPQKRSWIYLASGEEVGRHDEIQLIDVTQSRTVEGTKTPWNSTTDSFTPWENIGSRFDYTAWAPTVSLQSANFVQSREYSYNQERSRQKREKNALTNEFRNTGEATKETQTLKATEQRTVTVASGNWSMPTTQDCSAWTPSTNTVALNKEFTQTRNCNKTKTRTWTYKTGGSTLHTRVETNTYTQQESKKATGTNAIWEPYSSTFTEWENSSSPTSAQWTPSIKNQVSDFTQTLTTKQPQIRTEQKREIEKNTGQIRDAGSPIQHSRTLETTLSRNVTVTSSQWIIKNGKEERTFKYESNGMELMRRTEYRDITANWVPADSVNSDYIYDFENVTYTEYLPSPELQQSNYKQVRMERTPYTYYEQKRERDLVSGAYRNVGEPIKRTGTRENEIYRIVKVESKVSYSSWSSWKEAGSYRIGYDCDLIIYERKRMKFTIFDHIADRKIINSYKLNEEELETDSTERCWD